MRTNVIIILAILIIGLVGSLVVEIMFKVDRYDSSRINDLKSTPIESSLNTDLLLDVVNRSK